MSDPLLAFSLPAPIHLASREEALQRFGLCIRALGRVPVQREYVEITGVTRGMIARHFAGWHDLRQSFTAWARNQPQFVAEHRLAVDARGRGGVRRRRRANTALTGTLGGLPPLGDPVGGGCMIHAPVNEQGVVFLFGTLAAELGFRVLSLQCAFPDCLAIRALEGGRWEPLRVEFEFESRNFTAHGHDPAGCDLIVCWRNNWPECPLEVLELGNKRCA